MIMNPPSSPHRETKQNHSAFAEYFNKIWSKNSNSMMPIKVGRWILGPVYGKTMGILEEVLSDTTLAVCPVVIITRNTPLVKCQI